MVQYDPSVIQAVAQQLYNKANSIIIVNAFIGTVIGACVGGIGGYVANHGIWGGFIGGIIGFITGNEIGISNALLYKFQAQSLLAQIQIEINTRRLKEIKITTNEIFEILNEGSEN